MGPAFPALPERPSPFLPAFLFRAPPGAWGFALRTALSGCLALYAAFLFQLESPYWAATTALIVANPVYGQIVSKSVYRVIGTVAGVIMALVLTAWFAQTPELFILALSTWIGCCLAVATMLRNFQAYGAMLAGLTATIISLAVISTDPLDIFTVAMARMAAILVGIAASALVSGLLKPGGAARNMELRIQAMIRDSTNVLKMLADPKQVIEVKTHRRILAREILTLDGLTSFAAAESVRVEDQRNGLLAIGAAMLHAVTALGNAAYSINRMTVEERADPLLQAALAEVVPAANVIARLDAADLRELDATRAGLAALEEQAAHRRLDDVLVVIHRIQEIIEQLTLALRGWLEWEAGRPLETRARFDYHREIPDAVRNGGRCFLAVLTAGVFWIYSQWPSGPGLIIIVTVVCSFAATQEDPLAFGPPFLFGTLVLIPICMASVFLIFPHLTNFVPLIFVLMAIIMIGSLASLSTHRWLGGTGRVFLPLFFTILALRDPMIYDYAAFLNNAVATVAGVACAVMSTMLFLPPDPIGRSIRILRNFCHEAEILAAYETPDELPPRSVWESQMYDRLRLTIPLVPTEPDGAATVDSAYAALLIGASVIDLRERAALPAMPGPGAAIINRAVDRIAALRHHAGEIAQALATAAESLIQCSHEERALAPESRGLLVRCASTLRGMATLLGDEAYTFERLHTVGARS